MTTNAVSNTRAPRQFIPRWAAITSALLITGAIASIAAFQAIGSTISADGMLHEPFALIPLAWALALAAVGTLAVGSLGLLRRDR